MSKLFSEWKIKDMTLRNRIVMPPMCMYSATEDGMMTDWHPTHYLSRAIGGVGLIIIEAVAVSPEGRISKNDLGIWSDDHIPALRRLVDMLHEQGASVGIQINHAGRKCEAEGMQIEAPSPLPFSDDSPVPREMTQRDIEDTILEFRNAASRAKQAGFDLLQLHGAHGYLVSEYLSPLTNQRIDDYGGSPENRVRLLGRILDAVTEVWPGEKPLDLRVSAEDYAENGNKAEDVATLINLVKGKGVDMVNVSTGGVIPIAPAAFPGYQVPHAKIIAKKTGLPVATGGLITDPLQAEEILKEGSVDLVYVGRELLRDPYWPLRAAHVLSWDVEWPKQYLRAQWR